jgi:hypothetical protein
MTTLTDDYLKRCIACASLFSDPVAEEVVGDLAKECLRLREACRSANAYIQGSDRSLSAETRVLCALRAALEGSP